MVPMNVTRYGDSFEKRTDPWGRDYYWLNGGPPETTPGHETDLSALAKGKVTITPLDYNMTRKAVLAEMEQWQFRLPEITPVKGRTMKQGLHTMNTCVSMSCAGPSRHAHGKRGHGTSDSIDGWSGIVARLQSCRAGSAVVVAAAGGQRPAAAAATVACREGAGNGAKEGRGGRGREGPRLRHGRGGHARGVVVRRQRADRLRDPNPRGHEALQGHARTGCPSRTRSSWSGSSRRTTSPCRSCPRATATCTIRSAGS